MTPYTIRERRTNITKRPEAYPGQHEKLLADLIRHDREGNEAEREQAAVARAGGRLLTSKLPDEPEHFTPEEREALVHEGIADHARAIMKLRSLTLNHEQAALVRVALSVLVNSEGILSTEGRERVRELEARLEEIVRETR
jgi:hypothetical protein